MDKMFDMLVKFPQQCRQALEIGEEVPIPDWWRNSRGIVVAGMGGSSASGALLRDALQGRFPVHLVRDYQLPLWVDKEWLVVVVTYSGNTREALSCYEMARDRNCRTFVITSGGEIEKRLERAQVLCARIPSGLAPRASLGYLFFPLLLLANKIGLYPTLKDDMDDTLKNLQELSAEAKSDTDNNRAKSIAKCLLGKIPVVYGATCLESCVWRVKNQINEDAKLPCIANVVPELLHNEIEMWGSPRDDFHVIFLRDITETPEVSQKMERLVSICKEKNRQFDEIRAPAKTFLARLLWFHYYSDWLGYWLSIIGGIDPLRTPLIDSVKLP